MPASQVVVSPSSRGLGHRPFTAVTGVRIPLGTPPAENLIDNQDFFALISAPEATPGKSEDLLLPLRSGIAGSDTSPPLRFRTCNRAAATASSFARSAFRVYGAACCGLVQPNSAISSYSVAPASAQRCAASLRNPCALSSLSPAWRHRSLNQLPKPLTECGCP